jgi:hypothetical protein
MCDIKGSLHCIKETADVESCGTDASRTDIVSVEKGPVPLNCSEDINSQSAASDVKKTTWKSALAAEWHDLILAPTIMSVLIKRDFLVMLRKKILIQYSVRMFLFGVVLGKLSSFLFHTC